MELQIAFKSNIVVLFWFKIDKILCHSKVIRSSNSSVFLCRNKLWIPCELDQSMNVCKISDKSSQICNIKQWDANISLFCKLDLQLQLEEMGPIKIFTTLILFQGEDFFSSKSNEDSKTCVCVGLYFKQQAFHMIMIDRSSICSEKFERLRINKSKVSSQRHHHQMAPVTHAIATLQRLPQKKRQIYIPLNFLLLRKSIKF